MYLLHTPSACKYMSDSIPLTGAYWYQCVMVQIQYWGGGGVCVVGGEGATEPFGALWSPVEPFWNVFGGLWTPLKPGGTLRSSLELFGVFWNLFGATYTRGSSLYYHFGSYNTDSLANIEEQLKRPIQAKSQVTLKGA